MVDIFIAALTFFVCLIVALIYLYNTIRNEKQVPGLKPISKERGNLPDIKQAGTFREFICNLHQRFGPIASFWLGSNMAVSVASTELLKEQQHVFDRPLDMFAVLAPLIGSNSIQLVNGREARRRREIYDKALSHQVIQQYYPKLYKEFGSLETKWDSMTGEQIPLCQHIFAATIGVALTSVFGDFFEQEQEVLLLKKHYDLIWAEFELQLSDPLLDENSPRAKRYNKACEEFKVIVKRAMKYRRETGSTSSERLLVDDILDYNSDDVALSDCITFLLGSFHSTAFFLIFAIYFLALHQDIQEKVKSEIVEVLGNDGQVEPQNVNELTYLYQVLQETLRCASVAPFTARVQACDSKLGGYTIPKNTPVFHALDVVHKDGNVWPEPEKFDPDRFSAEQARKRPSVSFSPFGFAGKRICPGYRLAYLEAIVCIATLIRRFKVNLVEGQTVTFVSYLSTRPSEEIWVTASERNK